MTDSMVRRTPFFGKQDEGFVHQYCRERSWIRWSSSQLSVHDCRSDSPKLQINVLTDMRITTVGLVSLENTTSFPF
jgi:hypothetical protein